MSKGMPLPTEKIPTPFDITARQVHDVLKLLRLPMWCLKRVARRRSISLLASPTCLFSQVARRSPGLILYNHDDITYFNALEACLFTTKDGYTGPKTHEPFTPTKDLFNELNRSTPKHGPREEPKLSKAYDIANTFPDQYVTPAARVGSEYFKITQSMHHIEFQALVIGREIARRSKDLRELRRTFRRLFDHCNTVRDVKHVLSIAFQRSRSREAVQGLHQPIIRALYRSRCWATDRRVWAAYLCLILRFRSLGMGVHTELYAQCVKFAARSRDVTAMSISLWLFRARDVDMGYNLFRTIIAKFSIGLNGYGEIRNGRWNHGDIKMILLGFPDTKITGGEQEDHHLASFLRRDHWGYLCAWIQVLAFFRMPDELWKEWLVWRDSKVRQSCPKRLRRDMNFSMYMQIAGAPDRAWRISQESNADFQALDEETKRTLLAELGTRGFRHQEDLPNAPHYHGCDILQYSSQAEASAILQLSS